LNTVANKIALFLIKTQLFGFSVFYLVVIFNVIIKN